jgi:hypothetical protein
MWGKSATAHFKLSKDDATKNININRKELLLQSTSLSM